MNNKSFKIGFLTSLFAYTFLYLGFPKIFKDNPAHLICYFYGYEFKDSIFLQNERIINFSVYTLIIIAIGLVLLVFKKEKAKWILGILAGLIPGYILFDIIANIYLYFTWR